MLIKKPNFWDEDRLSFFSAILIPLTLVLKIAVFFKQILTREIKYNLPVICVGNIYLGGTGKTPLCIEITKILKEIGKNPVIIKKFYKEHEDEHLLTKHKVGEMNWPGGENVGRPHESILKLSRAPIAHIRKHKHKNGRIN